MLFLVVTLFVSSVPAMPAAKPECLVFQNILKTQWQELTETYKKVDSRFEKLDAANSAVMEMNSSVDLVILLHGYLGSPFEMDRMAAGLRAKGYSVLNDLIPGYGFSARVANHYTEDDWDRYFDIRYKSAFECYKRIHMIGFSTGGLIIHKFLKANPKMRAASVHLISPFFAPTFKFLSTVSEWFSLIKSETSLNLLYYATFRAKELEIMLMYPDNYLRASPNLNMNEIVKSGKEVVEMKSIEKNQSPVVLYATKKDLVMDFDVTKKIISRDYVGAQVVDYSQTQAPHHLFRHEVSEVALEFERTLLSAF